MHSANVIAGVVVLAFMAQVCAITWSSFGACMRALSLDQVLQACTFRVGMKTTVWTGTVCIAVNGCGRQSVIDYGECVVV